MLLWEAFIYQFISFLLITCNYNQCRGASSGSGCVVCWWVMLGLAVWPARASSCVSTLTVWWPLPALVGLGPDLECLYLCVYRSQASRVVMVKADNILVGVALHVAGCWVVAGWNWAKHYSAMLVSCFPAALSQTHHNAIVPSWGMTEWSPVMFCTYNFDLTWPRFEAGHMLLFVYYVLPEQCFLPQSSALHMHAHTHTPSLSTLLSGRQVWECWSGLLIIQAPAV